MTYKADALATATAKLDSLEFTEDETEAIAVFLRGNEVAGFQHDGQASRSFLLEVAGIMAKPAGYFQERGIPEIKMRPGV